MFMSHTMFVQDKYVGKLNTNSSTHNNRHHSSPAAAPHNYSYANTVHTFKHSYTRFTLRPFFSLLHYARWATTITTGKTNNNTTKKWNWQKQWSDELLCVCVCLCECECDRDEQSRRKKTTYLHINTSSPALNDRMQFRNEKKPAKCNANRWINNKSQLH